MGSFPFYSIVAIADIHLILYGISTSVVFFLTKTKIKKHFSKAYFILVIKTKTIIMTLLVC